VQFAASAEREERGGKIFATFCRNLPNKIQLKIVININREKNEYSFLQQNKIKRN